MNKYLFLLLFTGLSFAQKITVADVQLKIAPGGTAELFYGFADGDEILFTVEEITGKTISEVTVMEFPETYKYRAYNIKKEKNHELKVTNKAVYKFSLGNSEKRDRICTVKIQRIPDSRDLKNFNTGVKWVSRQDTLWNSFTKDVVTGYDTVYMQKIRRAAVFEKKYEEIVLDKNQRVDSKAKLGSTKTSVAFTLPTDQISQDETKKVIAWAYWVGVGEESNEFWKQNRKMIVEGVKGVAAMYTSPLGAIAAGAATNLILPANGEDVEYALANEANSKLFLQDKAYKNFDSGKGVAAYKRITEKDMLKGKYFVLLANDNYVQPIDVNVKVSAIIEHIRYKNETYTDRIISPRYEKKIMREPQIITTKVPVTFDYK